MSVVLASRLLGPEDLDANDQAKQCLYVLDAWDTGRWILPMERGTLPATKPPLYTWLALWTSAFLGGPTEFGCRLPSCAASLVVAWLVYLMGRERWSAAVGIAAAWIFASSHTAVRLAVHVRPDMVLTACTTGALYSIHRMELGRLAGMHALFWTCTSLSILAKGPPGPLVIFGTLLCLAISKERRALVLGVFKSVWPCLLLVPVLWFVLALAEGGKDYVETVQSQTFDRALAVGSRSGKGQIPGQILAIFAARFAPWSILAFAALAGLVSRRAAAGEQGKSILFAAWTFGGLCIFGLSRGQREDYILPMVPAACLLVAAALDSPRRNAVSRLWRAILTVLAGAALVLGAILPMVAAPNGVYLSVLLVASALLFARALLGHGRQGPESGLGRPFFAAAPGMLVLMLGYFWFAAPDGRSGRGKDLEEFAASVNEARRPDDDVRIFGTLANGIRFYTRTNQPACTREELASLMASCSGRLLVITNSSGAGDLVVGGPGAPEVLLSRRHGSRGDSLVLLHVKPSPPDERR